MNDNNLEKKFVSKSIESYVKTALVFLITFISFLIFKPFLLPVIWAIIIAIALFPLHKRLTKLLKNRSSLSATIITVVLLAAFIIPSVYFSGSLYENISELKGSFKEGALVIPPPSDDVAEWPVVGKKVHDIWQLFSNNLATGIEKYREVFISAGEKFISMLSGFVGSIFVFIISIIIAGVFLANSSGGYRFVYIFFNALIGEKGEEMVNNSKATIQSVVNGILGTAIIQTTILAIALFVFKVPGAAVFTIIVLLFSIAQLPAILVMLPVIIYMFSAHPGMQAVIFMVWAILGGLSDNFIKPMLLGRGMEIPMLVILIGAIGGMMLMGIIGLFIGAVVLALGYQLFKMWIDDAQNTTDEAKKISELI